MTPNPYTYFGRPIRKFQDFYGRKRELIKLTDDVRNGQCVSVVGIRRIGKSSLLYQLLDPVARAKYQLGDDVLCVYISCGLLSTQSPDEVYARIMHQTYRRLSKRHQTELERPETELSYYDFEEIVLKLHDAGLRLVLLLDEFEQLARNPHLGIDFFLGLRALHHMEYELTYVTASLHPIMELAFSHSEVLSSPFPNIFDSVRLGLFPEPEARAFIQVSRAFSPEVEDFLLGLTGGHPLALQYACASALARQQETNAPLTREDRHKVREQTQQAMESQYRRYCDHLSRDQKRVLAAPTHFAKQIKKQTPVANLFKDLVTLGLLVARPDDSFDYAGHALAEFVRLEMTRDKSLRDDLVGQTLGEYQITDRLGQGGMADVYKAHQPSLNRDIAIKVMLPHIAADENFSIRFRREASAVAALRHPHIVRVYNFDQEDDIYYMVMEYIPGTNLDEYLQTVSSQGKKMSLKDILRIMTQVGQALHYAHEQDLVHRDIKPANVMLTPDEQAILTDFGMARILKSTRFTGSQMIGTHAYMAPEQIEEAATVDRRADIYALGIVLYEMATGQVPFDADKPIVVLRKHLEAPLPDPHQLRPDLPDSFVQVLEKALAKKPKERYQTVQEMLHALAAQVDPNELFQALQRYFNDSELRSLCFNLSIEYDGLPGRGKQDKARELVAYCERHNHISDLVIKVKSLRPHVSL